MCCADRGVRRQRQTKTPSNQPGRMKRKTNSSTHLRRFCCKFCVCLPVARLPPRCRHNHSASNLLRPGHLQGAHLQRGHRNVRQQMAGRASLNNRWLPNESACRHIMSMQQDCVLCGCTQAPHLGGWAAAAQHWRQCQCRASHTEAGRVQSGRCSGNCGQHFGVEWACSRTWRGGHLDHRPGAGCPQQACGKDCDQTSEAGCAGSGAKDSSGESPEVAKSWSQRCVSLGADP